MNMEELINKTPQFPQIQMRGFPSHIRIYQETGPGEPLAAIRVDIRRVRKFARGLMDILEFQEEENERS